MKQAVTLDDFVRAPVGQWATVGTTVFWSYSATLCGTYAWGRPDADVSRMVMPVYFAYRQLAPQFDVIIDGSALEGLIPESIFVMMEWLRSERAGLAKQVGRQIGVMPAGLDGLVLAGVAPVIASPHPITLVTEARDGFRLLLPEGGEALADEVDAIVSAVRGIAPVLVRLRSLLRANEGRLTLDDAARSLGVSTRSLQRQLGEGGGTFRDEVLEARFEALTRLLDVTDDKITAIAAHLGITKAALSTLTRERTQLKPLEYRNALREKRRGVP